MPGLVPVLLVGVLIPLTAWSWRSTGLTRGTWPLGLGWTWLWAELGCAVWILWPRSPHEPPMAFIEGAPELSRAAPDMLVQPRPPLDTPFLLFLGDSFTAGRGVYPQETFAAHTTAAWSVDHPGLVGLNHGVPGASFFETLADLAVLSRPDAPDVVVWTFFMNDLGLATGPSQDLVSMTRWPERLPASPLAWMLTRAAATRRITQASLDAYRHSLRADSHDWRLFEEALPRAVEAVTGRGGRFVFMVFPILHDLQGHPLADEHARLARVAEAAGAEVVDLQPVLRDHPDETLWVHPEDRHPNAFAHRLVAEHLTEVLRAGPLPSAGPPDCDTWLLAPSTAAIERQRCVDGSPESLRAAGEALAALPDGPLYQVLDPRGVGRIYVALAERRAADPVDGPER